MSYISNYTNYLISKPFVRLGFIFLVYNLKMRFVCTGHKYLLKYVNHDAMGVGVQLAQLAMGKSCKLGGNLQYEMVRH